MQPNPGHLPQECCILDRDGAVTGYRKVHVRCFGGFDSRAAGHAPWPSFGGRLSTNWRIGTTPHAFDIREFEVV